MRIVAIVVGIDGYDEYTEPLLRSIWAHERDCDLTVIDNESEWSYPWFSDPSTVGRGFCYTERVSRCNYSTAINRGHFMSSSADWYIVLSNDVLCTGPFSDLLAGYDGKDLVGPLMKQAHGFDYLEGWCVCIPGRAWVPWDEHFLGSDYEDVDYSTRARKRGFGLVEDTSLPFVHLDQRQRFHVVPDFWAKNSHNRDLFLRKHGTPVLP